MHNGSLCIMAQERAGQLAVTQGELDTVTRRTREQAGVRASQQDREGERESTDKAGRSKAGQAPAQGRCIHFLSLSCVPYPMSLDHKLLMHELIVEQEPICNCTCPRSLSATVLVPGAGRGEAGGRAPSTEAAGE